MRRSRRRSAATVLLIALGLTAFLAVMREGAETIVFFQALLAGATEKVERHAVAVGIIAGAVALAITFVVLRRLTKLIPIGPVFSVTSVLLYALAIIFAGQGIASFQESGVIGATFVSYVPTLPMIGLFPTLQTIAAQAVADRAGVGRGGRSDAATAADAAKYAGAAYATAYDLRSRSRQIRHYPVPYKIGRSRTGIRAAHRGWRIYAGDRPGRHSLALSSLVEPKATCSNLSKPITA